MTRPTIAGLGTHEGPHWSVSPLNYAEPIRGGMNLPATVTLCDSTLREGGVQAGVKFTLEEQCRIATLLDELGVGVLGLFLANTVQDLYEQTKMIKDLGLNAKLQGLVQPFYDDKARGADWKEVLHAQLDAGIDIVEMNYYLTDWRLNGSIYPKGTTAHQVIDQMSECIAYVKAQGGIPFPAVTDTARVDIELLKTAYRANVEAGAEILAVNDSFGAMIPSTMRYIVEQLKEATGGATIKAHCHNDLGLALANTLAAVEGGADMVDGGLNGYGDRGFTDLASLAVNLTVHYGYDLGIDMARLYDVCKEAEAMTQMPIAQNWPLIGDFAFSTSGELHHQVADDQKWSATVLDTSLYGKQPRLFVSVMSGPVAVRNKLAELGINVDDEKLQRVVAKVHERDRGSKGILSDDDVRRIVADVA